MALAIGAVYLTWRTTTLGNGPLLSLSVPVFALEVWAYVELALFALQAWRVPAVTLEGTRLTTGPVDIAIWSDGCEPSELERSLITGRRVVGRGRMVVIDRTDRPEIKALAERFGADHVVEHGAEVSPLQATHRHTASDLYVWLTAGDVPMPDLLQRMAVQLARTDVAVSQVATGLLNADSLIHLRRERDDDALLNRVMGPALARWGAAPWLGPASIVRRRAMDAVGGPEGVRSPTHMAVRLHRHGWVTTFERRRLISTTAPDTLEQYLDERKRRTTAMLDLLRSRESPLRVPGLSLRHRVAHLAGIATFGIGIRQAGGAALLSIALVVGAFPSDAPVVGSAALAAGALLTRAIARTSLARGAMTVGDWLRHGWRTLGADLAAVRAAARETRSGAQPRTSVASGVARTLPLSHLGALTAIMVVLDVALLGRAAVIVEDGFLPALSTSEQVVLLGLALAVLGSMLDVLQVVARRRQRRAHPRLSANLAAEVDGTAATTVDVAPNGVGLMMPVEPRVGAATTLSVALPPMEGAVRRISGRAVVRDVRPHSTGGWRVGLEFSHLSEPARQALVELCAVGLPGLDDRSQDELPLAPVAHLTVPRSRRDQRSLQVFSGTAAAAAVLTMIFGPTARAAAPDTVEHIELACVTTADDEPVAGAVIERIVRNRTELLGATDSSGCVRIASHPHAKGFAVTHRGIRRAVQPSELGDTTAEVVLGEHRATVVDIDGEPAEGVAVRFFAAGWQVGRDRGDGTWFDALSTDFHVEVSMAGGRFVRPMDPSGDLLIRLGILRTESTAAAEAMSIDRGKGWEPVVDGMPLIPGRLVLRLGDGQTLKVDLPEGHELRLPDGELRPVELPAAPDPEPESEPQPGQPADGASEEGDG